ncbi:MAG: hypothetical protein ACYDA4_03715 [Ignavibacteriaceae bacterium]
MPVILSIIIICLAIPNDYCQDKTYSFNSFSLKIVNNELTAVNSNKKVFYQKKFHNPKDFALDLNGDGAPEFLISDSYDVDSSTFYTLFIYNTMDSLSLADSILSGLIEPYEINSSEAGGMIIVSGNPAIDSLNTDLDNIFLPVNCWKYEKGELFSVNDQVYKIFTNENNGIIDYLDNYYASKHTDCESTSKVKAALASGYINFMHSGDKILARQFLNEYYHCSDLYNFEQYLNKICEASK